MKKLIFILALCLLTGNVFAQSGWQWVNPLPQGNDLFNVKFVNNNTAFSIGEKNTVMKTTNGGINWNVKNIGNATGRLIYISIVDSLVIFVLNIQQNLFKTTNSGENWVQLPNVPDMNYNSDLNILSFINSDTGFFSAHGDIYKTINGGYNWNLIYSLGAGTVSADLFFINSQTGFFSYFSDSTRILRTTNQGLNWNVCYKRDSLFQIKNIQFLNTNVGYAFYENLLFGGPSHVMILKTTNSGLNWFNIPKFITPYYYHHINFFNEGTGVLFETKTIANAQNLKAYKTTNDGLNWDVVANYNSAITANVMQSGLGFIVGFGGSIFKTSNSGSNWNYLNSSLGELAGLNTLKFVDSTTGYITGAAGIFLKSTNQGLNWVRSNIGYNNLTSSFFINSQTGYIGSEKSKLYKTTNSGNSWDTISLPFPHPDPRTIYSIYFIDSNIGFAGSETYIYKTTNAGLNWKNVFETGSNIINSIHFINSTTGYFYNYKWSYSPGNPSYYMIYKSTNSGDNWNSIYYETNLNTVAGSVKFISSDIGYRNLGGAVYKTLNGGLNWFPILNYSDGTEIKILPNSIIYLGSYKSTNNGVNWTVYETKVQTIKDIQYINNLTGFLIGGNGGAILRTTDGGEIISSVYGITSNEITDNFSLHQNYPNPFNPSTVIRYQLSVAGFITLKVFDLLGKEVAALVNEKQNAGSYSVDFNSTEFNLPSGIYFYTLNAGEFKETRKMILIK
ncbi:MAG: T9SS type A sorting domain-containing protein [Bacteroidetes bacterium]|nr:T9SS type A sorting domain-containing protein [Bacteroidota bacterium]